MGIIMVVATVETSVVETGEEWNTAMDVALTIDYSNKTRVIVTTDEDHPHHRIIPNAFIRKDKIIPGTPVEPTATEMLTRTSTTIAITRASNLCDQFEPNQEIAWTAPMTTVANERVTERRTTKSAIRRRIDTMTTDGETMTTENDVVTIITNAVVDDMTTKTKKSVIERKIEEQKIQRTTTIDDAKSTAVTRTTKSVIENIAKSTGSEAEVEIVVILKRQLSKKLDLYRLACVAMIVEPFTGSAVQQPRQD